MGGSHRKPTALDCMLKNFRKGFGGNYRVKMTPGRLCTLCELEWPSFDVRWPSEGTLDLPMIRQVFIVVTGTPGHPDQFPYIDSWLEVARTLPLWVRFCSNSKGQSRVLVAQNPQGRAQKDKTKTIYQGEPNEEPPPPPYASRPMAGTAQPLPDTPLPASASPWSQPN
ncbi:hypothetical protein mRhiFer1_007878 [Rhinolophus ferrumequinum]|uniref:Gamma-retroviral matrix protein domain-containing protein n=1 Tax=Rhinolophus ferrumequinum TaxID=59479 RepID=A0A7J8AV68_RHIFE|nr:hypothetical protein mRhiFer1_007878 [Rhinolophus ferrumequinum]